jgi:DNA polymerase elongation subunit (family B)
VRFLTIGRLLVDTFTSAKEMLKSSDYSLDYLSKKYLQKPCIAVESDVTAEYMEHESLIS